MATVCSRVLLCIIFLFCVAADEVMKAVFPLQLRAKIEITAHLIDPNVEVPPRVRRMTINYDYIKKKARADIEEGYEVEKTCKRHFHSLTPIDAYAVSVCLSLCPCLSASINISLFFFHTHILTFTHKQICWYSNWFYSCFSVQNWTDIRRYDNENEYMMRHSTINDCKRSYLGETMPFPEVFLQFEYQCLIYERLISWRLSFLLLKIPVGAKFVNTEVVNGLDCNHFSYEDFDIIVHMYFSKNDGAPVKLIQESTANGVSTPLLTFDFSDVEIGPMSEQLFELPEPYSHSSCERHLGGFPYLHVFHYFVRF